MDIGRLLIMPKIQIKVDDDVYQWIVNRTNRLPTALKSIEINRYLRYAMNNIDDNREQQKSISINGQDNFVLSKREIQPYVQPSPPFNSHHELFKQVPKKGNFIDDDEFGNHGKN